MRLFFTFRRSREEFKKGVYCMLLSSGMLSFFTLFSKFAADHVSYFLLVFLRFCVPLLLVLPLVMWRISVKELFQMNHYKLQLLRAGCILVYQYALFYYLMQSTLLNATVLQNTAPLFMPILERIFLGHRFSKRILLSIFVSFAGVLCILQPDRGIFATLSIAGILAPLSQAGSQVLYGYQARKENQGVNLFHFYFLTSLVAAGIYLFSTAVFKEQGSSNHFTLFAWVNIICLGIASIFNQIFRGVAYQHGKASALAPFLYISLICSAILDWAVFHHVPNWLSLLGALLVIAGGSIQVLKIKRVKFW